VGERLVLVVESVEACPEGGHALIEVRGVEVAGLESVLVAVDRAFRSGDLLGEQSAFGGGGAVGVIARGGLLDGVTDEPAAAVDAGELCEDRVL
jgi:hypothetical protein